MLRKCPHCKQKGMRFLEANNGAYWDCLYCGKIVEMIASIPYQRDLDHPSLKT